MCPANRPLTLYDDPSDDRGRHRNHPSGDDSHKSLYTNQVSPTLIPSSISTTKPRPTQGSQSLGQLAGYATSQEELETALAQDAKIGQPKKTIVYKSAEFVGSDSSEGKASRPLPRQARSLRTSASLKHHKRAMGTVPHLASHSKLDSQTRKKNMTANKRSTSALASPSMEKRPNTRGGFVMDSESDSEGSDGSDRVNNSYQSRSSVRPLPRPTEPPLSIQTNLKIDCSATSLPTKQLNKGRLNKLLGRGKGVSTTTPKENQLLVHTQSSIKKSLISSTTSHLAASLEPQQSANLQSTGSLDADRIKRPTTAGTTKETKVLSQQAKVLDSSIAKTDDKVSSISRGTQQLTAVITDHNRMPMQTNPASTPPTSAAAGLSSSLLLQQRKLVAGAIVARERKNGTLGNKTSSATQPRSIFQSTLAEVRIDIVGNTPDTQSQISGQDDGNIAKKAPVLTTSIRKSGIIPQSYVKEHETTAASAKFKKCSSSAIHNLKVSKDVATQRAQRHTQTLDLGPGKSTPAASKADAASSKPTPSTPGPSAQKRKLDSISGRSDYISTIASKKPAPAFESLLKRPEATQTISKADTGPRSDTFSKAVVHKTPTETTKSPGFVTTAPSMGSNLSSAWAISERKTVGVLHSPVLSTLVGRQESSEPTSSNMCATPEVSQLPVHASKAAINKPAEKSSTFKATLLSQAKPVDRPESSATVPAKPNPAKSQSPTEHASVAHDTVTPAQHKDSSTGVTATSSSEPPVSSERPAANKPGGDVQGLSSKENPRRVAVTPYPEKALSLSVNTRPEELRQVADPCLAVEEQHGSTFTSLLVKVLPVPITEPLLSATSKGSVSSFSTTVSEPEPSTELQTTDLAESTNLETVLPVSTESFENMALRSAETLIDNTAIEVDSVDTTATFVPQDDASASTMSVSGAANDFGPSHQPRTVVQTMNGSPWTTLRPSSPKQVVIDACKIALTSPTVPPMPTESSSEVATDSNEAVLPLSCSPQVSKEAQPYFEYSIFQKVWSSEQTEEDTTANEIIVRPFSSIVEANGQAEKAFQDSRTYFFDAMFESSSTRDEHGCAISTGSIAPFDNPTKKTHVKIWVQRDIVSKFANQTPQTLTGTCFISSTCYILRLFNLTEHVGTDISNASDSDDGDSPACEFSRVYESHSRPEIYTTLDAANRAARALQIELSHEKQPKDESSRAFQEKNLRELNMKLRKLQSSNGHGGDGCWRSQFHARGLGADTLEVVVEKAAICGPRNL
ncbi:hypothetical protein G6011_06086 [Alternaria panax]|uniref:Uncharacterized protein n=1 Tax=Alternaria panax TaxID=48097 RepID=A0AAD4FFV5_9PLEO|nr:hypothetical protein G6011_06086 [Alternaria panax]